MSRKRMVAVLTVVMLLLASCSSSTTTTDSSSSSSYDGYSDDYYESSYDEVETETDASDISVQSQMVIKNASMTMETDDYSTAETEMLRLIYDYGGYVQSSSSSVRERNGVEYQSGSYVLKVPADDFEDALEQVKELGKISNMNSSQEDVSSEYYDMESRLQTQQAEAAQLEQLIENTSDLTTKLALEVHLTEVREQIYILQSRMTNVERQVAYSTISVTLTEVTTEQMAESTFLTEVKAALSGSLSFCQNVFEGIVVLGAGVIVPLAIVVVFAVIIVLIYKNVKRKRAKHEGE